MRFGATGLHVNLLIFLTFWARYSIVARFRPGGTHQAQGLGGYNDSLCVVCAIGGVGCYHLGLDVSQATCKC